MSHVYYTSDLHLGHRKVSGLRGFFDEDAVSVAEGTFANDGAQYFTEPDPQSHDDELARNWDNTVTPADHVFILGDIAVSSPALALGWLAERPGRKHLIAGNHDRVHPSNRDSYKHLREWMLVFDSVQPFLRRKLAGTDILLSHFPYASYGEGPLRGGAAESRMNQYRLPDMGELLLHGHTHGPEKAHDNMFHVGLDAWDMNLVHQDTIIKWIESKKEAVK